ncbi:hypothetical protein GPK34_00955 [Secundilactobacillus kimchicus]|uniref:hypothetical protein n=1 Tax=Secundilactobacillus kimchicus TaxID=528209 RepID=UPI001C027FB1|nr:hypothetical protein [Secundilactobacillus kimchicus]MBT9670606.1 hypothetical protein [Secundilactobacillus kimchicus]
MSEDEELMIRPTSTTLPIIHLNRDGYAGQIILIGYRNMALPRLNSVKQYARLSLKELLTQNLMPSSTYSQPIEVDDNDVTIHLTNKCGKQKTFHAKLESDDYDECIESYVSSIEFAFDEHILLDQRLDLSEVL